MINIDASKVLDQQMNRKQFLRNVGVGVVALTGLGAAIKALGQMSGASEQTRHQVINQAASATAYGGSAYGGKPVQS